MNSLQKIKFRFENQEHEALTQKIGNQVWVYFRGKIHALPLTEANKKSRRHSQASGSSSQVFAPMPGKITKVLLAEGAQADVGQVVIVMEAMKMEYTLKSEVKSKVKKIFVKVGDQVTLGQSLMDFESILPKTEEKK